MRRRRPPTPPTTPPAMAPVWLVVAATWGLVVMVAPAGMVEVTWTTLVRTTPLEVELGEKKRVSGEWNWVKRREE